MDVRRAPRPAPGAGVRPGRAARPSARCRACDAAFGSLCRTSRSPTLDQVAGVAGSPRSPRSCRARRPRAAPRVRPGEARPRTASTRSRSGRRRPAGVRAGAVGAARGRRARRSRPRRGRPQTALQRGVDGRDTTRPRGAISPPETPDSAPIAAAAASAAAAGAGAAPAVLTTVALLLISFLAGALLEIAGLPRLLLRAARLERPG